MCGRCRKVFNAFQSLSRVEESNQTHVASLQQALAEPASDLRHPSEPSYSEPAAFSAIDMAPEPVADSLFLREEPLPLPAAFSAATPVPRAPVALATEPIEYSGSHTDFDPTGESGTTEISDTHNRSRDEQLAEPAIDLSEEGNPLLFEPPASREATLEAPSRAWSVGVFVLFVALLALAAYAFRTTLVSNYPQLRPAANQLCEMAGCSIPWGRDDTALEIIASELIETPGKPGRILLTAILVNRGKAKQDMPSLELRLTDNANQVVVRRVLQPGDYLGRPLVKDEGMEPKAELYINLNLELGEKATASGYGLLPFYP